MLFEIRAHCSIDFFLRQGTMYLTNITVGNPPQHVRLIIDTGSSDTWCNTNSSDFCSQNPSYCEQFGTYNANSSSTYKYLNSDLELAYVDGSSAHGDFVSDNLEIGGKTLPNFEFGAAYTSSSIGKLVLHTDAFIIIMLISLFPFGVKASLDLDMSGMKPPRGNTQIYPRPWSTTGL